MGFVIDAAYAAILVLLGPFWWAARRRKGKRSPPLRERLGRFAPPPPPTGGPRVWIHAVSVGETLAARGLVAELRRRRPDLSVVLTSTTVAGLEVARRTYPDLPVFASPLDFTWATARFFERIGPDALVLIELELWPNLLRAAARRGVPVFVANARVSERSAGRYRFLTRLWPGFLRPITRFLAQGPEHAERLRKLGVPASAVVETGNLKFDNAAPADPTDLRRTLRAELGIAPEAPLLVAGSTHPGEERIVGEAFRRILAGRPEARMILAPRHLERLAEVTETLSALQLRPGRRSDPNRPSDRSCLLLDTTGELGRFYAAADVAFVGGSLVPIGGHNLLEPAVYGTPMVVGPHLKTVRDTADLFAEVGALVEVKDAAALAACVETMFASPDAARMRGAAAQGLIESRRGAAARCAETILAGLRRGAARERMSDG